MSKRGSDFLSKWIPDHLPDGPIADPVLLVIDMVVDAKRAAEAQGIPQQEIDEEIGSVYEAIMHTLQDRTAKDGDDRQAGGNPKS
ncbi:MULTISPECIES: DUF768 domain-containing protein [unclassified Mesorhizobium]|uniref:DUF768 domain-containing protein n=1 Tax=unclassified Mesorhizobium TaxID=325217 RepID=UPI000FD89600|nr:MULTISPECIES: DUF768 domain-containing protein [unclassified Mesorhizobium]TGQ45730.1 DUF768 domain-containing protein [Mesorhizobium sp. M00.F.Ca.ET.216.01.1.1]TIS56265.1 MAG: DUF768 domain-containing protein [Mesorhizobium sp.]TIS87580.1 MAG: DUF768 domain-containing protein [Mesorhizobium sp.]TJW12890.1 MAG: DUF768 domain-containing protein [Mesorhizobium sp.]TJW42285.1 MAG: DUF768 domain-containing protein [Mesorhizobium sp.]